MVGGSPVDLESERKLIDDFEFAARRFWYIMVVLWCLYDYIMDRKE